MPPIPKRKKCPVCRQPSCYHCWDCKRDLSRREHKSTCRNWRPIKPLQEHRVVCIACGDTGKNSRGGPCSPCVNKGRV